MKEFLEHMFRCRNMAPSSTRALILVPKWPQEPWYKMLKGCTLLHEYPSGTELFTYLNSSGTWQPARPLQWPVQMFLLDEDSTIPTVKGIHTAELTGLTVEERKLFTPSAFCHQRLAVLTEHSAHLFEFPGTVHLFMCYWTVAHQQSSLTGPLLIDCT